MGPILSTIENATLFSDREDPSDRASHAPPSDNASESKVLAKIGHIGSAVVRRSIAPIVLIGLWQLACSAGWVEPSVLAPPSQVWRTFIELAGNGEILRHVGISLQRVLLGLAIGGSIAVVLGVASGLSKLGEEAIDPPLQMIRAMPSLGTAPLLVIWLGIDEGVKVGLVAIGVVFPLYINIYKGIRGIDRRFAELARACNASRPRVVCMRVLSDIVKRRSFRANV